MFRNIALAIYKKNLERKFSNVENSLLKLLANETDAPIEDAVSDLRDVQLKYLRLMKRFRNESLKKRIEIAWDWGEYLSCVEDYILGIETGVHDAHMENEGKGTRSKIYDKFENQLTAKDKQ